MPTVHALCVVCPDPAGFEPLSYTRRTKVQRSELGRRCTCRRRRPTERAAPAAAGNMQQVMQYNVQHAS